MKIIVVSDSHGKQGILEQIVEKHPDADAYLHCGDIEDYAENYPSYIVVQGNNDIYYDYPDERVITAGSHLILNDWNKWQIRQKQKTVISFATDTRMLLQMMSFMGYV